MNDRLRSRLRLIASGEESCLAIAQATIREARAASDEQYAAYSADMRLIDDAVTRLSTGEAPTSQETGLGSGR